MKLGDIPNIVLTASGKGGVGKTTVASDIARIAADEGVDVGFIDADVSTPNSLEVLGGEGVDVSDQRLSTADALVPPEVEGVQLVSQSLVLPDDVPVLRGAEWRAETVVDYIQNVEWKDGTELVVIDSPPGSGEELQVVASSVPLNYAYVVSTPHPSACRDASKTHEFFKQAGLPHEGVLNMAYMPKEAVISHVLDDVDLQQIQGVGESTEESIREIIEETAERLPLFAFDESDPPDFGPDIAAVLPYSESFGRRKMALGVEVSNLLERQEVEA